MDSRKTLETAPGGIPVSLTSMDNPDFEKHPGFEEALKHRFTAQLNPGDAIYIPPGWWHHVRAEAPLNMLVNYWWSGKTAQINSPYAAMVHAMMAFKSLTEAERKVWGNMFDYFVFEKHGEAMGHIDPLQRGVLGGVLLIAELREERRAQFFFKPLAAFGFVILALQFGALESTYGLIILAGLIACAVGDIFLLSRKSENLFKAGMAAFALGHVFYVIAISKIRIDFTTDITNWAVIFIYHVCRLRYVCRA